MTALPAGYPSLLSNNPSDSGYLERSVYTPMAILPSTLICGMSWVCGGIPMLTDLGFFLLTLVMIGLLIAELWHFPRRFGVGGLVFYGGVLIWFCYDYMTNYFGKHDSHLGTGFPADVIAKCAFLHMFFIMMMLVGMMLPVGSWLKKTLDRVPEPTDSGFFFWIVIAMVVVGLSPYYFFTSEAWYLGIWKELVGGRNSGAQWTVGRTGNLNYDWGGYVAQITQIGKTGGQLAIFYALLIAKKPAAKVVGILIWLFWVGMAVGSGTRSQVVFMTLPAIALLFLKYQAIAASLFKKISPRAYLFAGLLGLGALFLVQFQSLFRNTNYLEADLADVSVTSLEGNSMFSEGMIGYMLIPEKKDFFYNTVPGESIFRPIPQTLFFFAIGPIPRALWNSKPIDPVWAWYNSVYLGTDDGTEGTTIATGLVGCWYFPYGIPGIIEGGIALGWVMILLERILQQAQGRPLVILLSLALADWQFRNFRALNFSSLYQLAIGWGMMLVLIMIQRSLFGRGKIE